VYSEEEFLPISALQHLAFCERQWALIHLEQIWKENLSTREGEYLHEKVHQEDEECREGVRVVHALRLRSFSLGLAGQADVVEFPLKDLSAAPRVVEYKRGKPKKDHCDEVQLCAQALCLEEMLGTHCFEGDLFYGRPRRRHPVLLSEDLREETCALAERLHRMQREGQTPPAHYGPKCDQCSLAEFCLPRVTEGRKSARRYLRDLLRGDDDEGRGAREELG
jgi:CRISPR-associated exonuclease Cas4